MLRSRDDSEPCTARMMSDPDQIATVVSTYLAQMNAPWAVAQFPFAPDASRSEIAALADHVAVFELTPARG